MAYGEWINEFNSKLKNGAYEQFSTLMCDLDSCESEQRELLHRILFKDHKSLKYWYDYVNCVVRLFPDRKHQLLRVINKAIKYIEVKENKDHRQYVELHIQCAKLQQNEKFIIRHFETTHKQEIGRRFASLYLEWAEVHQSQNNIREAIEVLKSGMAYGAEPSHILINRISELKNQLTQLHKTSEKYDDGEICFKSRCSTGSTSSASSGDTDDKTEEKTVHIPSEMVAEVPAVVAPVSPPRRSTRSTSSVAGRGLRGLGKCQRVINGSSSTSQSSKRVIDEVIELRPQNTDAESDNDTTCTDAITLPPPAATVDKSNLKKYVDDKLLNFDPEAYRKSNAKQSSNSATASASTSSNSTTFPTAITSAATTAAVETTDHTAASNSSNDTTAPLPDNATEITEKLPVPPPVVMDEVVVVENQSIRGKRNKKRVSFAGDENDAPRKRATATHDDEISINMPQATDPKLATNTVTINNKQYMNLGFMGKGGSCSVYRVLSVEDGKMYAYKRVDLNKLRSDNPNAVLDGYINEIAHLKKLNGSAHIIQLYDAVVNREEQLVSLILEIGETDLAKALVSHHGPDKTLNPFFARMVWQQMLEAVDHIHEHRIVHGDLKPANFVFVKGHLKLIDFGIAKAISNDTTNIYRESHMGTINYMAPEAVCPLTNDADGTTYKVGKPSDIWSLGCILYQMVYGKAPFAHLSNLYQKMAAIPNPKYEIVYASSTNVGGIVDVFAIETMRRCLVRDPHQRATIRGENGLLSLPYLNIAKCAVATPKSDIPYATASKLVQLVYSEGKKSNFSSDTAALCEKVLSILNNKLDSNALAVPENKENAAPLVRTRSKNKQSPAVIEKRQPLAQSFKEQLTSTSLKPLPNSNSSRWMKPKGTSPEKQDMYSAIARRMSQIRPHMESHDDTTANSADMESEFSLQNLW